MVNTTESYPSKFPFKTNSETSLINFPVTSTLNLPKKSNRKIVQDPICKDFPRSISAKKNTSMTKLFQNNQELTY